MAKGSDLLEAVYAELTVAARRYAVPGQSIEPTDLVHEVFLRMHHHSWESEAHFRAVATRAMRQVIIDHARRRGTEKRGGDRLRVTLSRLGGSTGVIDLIDLDQALTALAAVSERKARVASMRIFGGMKLGEIAQYLSVSEVTIKRDWRTARAWLMTTLA